MEKMEQVQLFPDEGNTLLIFGNGFDINLGFPTSYKDYFISDYFPFVHDDQNCHSLGHYVYEKGILEKWYDLENMLAEYGRNIGAMTQKEVEGDKEDFSRLVLGLSDYLNTLDYRQPKIDSVAANILRAANDHLLPPTIFTFNYTDLEAISKFVGADYSNIQHVHGSLRNNDIVLGVGEYVNLGPSASYLYKTSILGYNSRGVLDSFESYDTIIVFGLSLSQVDYPYFEDFFKDVAARKYFGNEKKYIRIFTYDEKSRQEILDNLRGMNSGLIKLMGYSNFDIIRVKDDVDDAKVQEVIRHLSMRWEVAKE